MSSRRHREPVSGVAVESADGEACYVWSELLDLQLLSPGGIHWGRKRGLLLWAGRTLDAARVHTTGPLSTSPAQCSAYTSVHYPLEDTLQWYFGLRVHIQLCYYVLCSLRFHEKKLCQLWWIKPFPFLLFNLCCVRKTAELIKVLRQENPSRYLSVFRVLGRCTCLELEGIPSDDTIGFRWQVPVHVNTVQMSLLDPEGTGSRWYYRRKHSRRRLTWDLEINILHYLFIMPLFWQW